MEGNVAQRRIRAAKMLDVAGAYHSRLMNSAFVALGPIFMAAACRNALS